MIERLKEIINIYPKILGVFTSIFIFIGFIVFYFYCISLNYFPEGLSLTDNITIVIISVTFTLLYSLFCLLLLSLSITLRPIWNFLFNGIPYLRVKLKKRENVRFIPFYKGNWILIIPSFLATYIILRMGLEDSNSYVYFGITLFFISLIFSYLKNNELNIDLGINIFLFERKKSTLSRNIICIVMIFALPVLLLANHTFYLVERSMTLIGIRVESINLHVRHPYNIICATDGFILEKSSLGDEYSLLKNVEISFQGLGRNTVIRGNHNNNKVILKIPNEYLLSESNYIHK